jgi:hypothetical protein
MIWLGVGKCMNVFGHIFMKNQLTNIKYISNRVACDWEEILFAKNLRENVLEVQNLKKSPNGEVPAKSAYTDTQQRVYPLSFEKSQTEQLRKYHG